MPKSLDFSRLQQFEPESRQRTAPRDEVRPRREAPDSSFSESSREGSYAASPARWPSRQEVRDGQISIKAPLDIIERFKLLCKSDRRTYADMLDILMREFEGQGRR
ncbi:translation initiation factor 2 beta subunit (eIF-2beta)/eIF-5 [Limimaricola variabilis]|uniref:Translation initiation factor 2 beta subunit (eIF-2beta)/eIF-5 n=1 Tax=Limimaricola variabilis TaxID=1492771 RepID=A0ABR6HR98_9RHOB|nr:hypothetical protein [Limimaricola variabilis]MBB3713062.1 translation initiation factor 2 beta subunit (eIF-2beta)/eIF-5 [Limimaricola variabilis]